MIPENLQDAIVAEISQIFSHFSVPNSAGGERHVQVFKQNVPIRQFDDDTENADVPPEPYVVVKLNGGTISAYHDPHKINVIFVVCVYDENADRQGYRDMLHIVNEIFLHYAKNNVIDRKWNVAYPLEWTPQEDDTHPYYFGALSMWVEGGIFVEREL